MLASDLKENRAFYNNCIVCNEEMVVIYKTTTIFYATCHNEKHLKECWTSITIRIRTFPSTKFAGSDSIVLSLNNEKWNLALNVSDKIITLTPRHESVDSDPDEVITIPIDWNKFEVKDYNETAIKNIIVFL